MHEFSVAQGIMDIAEKEMLKANATGIRELELEIGTLAGIEFESLQFALKALVANTVFEQMQIVIHKPAGRARCDECHTEFEVSSFIAQCPSCKGFKCSIFQGKELRVKSIVI